MKTKTFRKILIAILAMSLLVLALLVPGFAKTDAEVELDAAKAEVAACEQKLADAKAAYETAQSQNNQGTYGFFQWAGATNAIQTLDNAKYRNLIAYGTAGDATSLDNLETALQLIDKVNEYRAGEGLDQLVVTDTMMAMAEADADAYYNLNTTPKQFTIGGHKIAENLGTFASVDKAAESWFSERKLAEQHPEYMDYNSPNWYQVGHWFNMSHKTYTVTGAAVNTRLGNKFCQVYYSNANNEQTYTTTQYRERIRTYRVSADAAKKAMDEAQAALSAAQVRQATAQRIVDAEQQKAAQ
ncbi:MAG: hypothetical protein J6T14_05835 [Clostridia bacterium]|nr:hypothetical protein [Clostridia bacterium]